MSPTVAKHRAQLGAPDTYAAITGRRADLAPIYEGPVEVCDPAVWSHLGRLLLELRRSGTWTDTYLAHHAYCQALSFQRLLAYPTYEETVRRLHALVERRLVAKQSSLSYGFAISSWCPLATWYWTPEADGPVIVRLLK